LRRLAVVLAVLVSSPVLGEGYKVPPKPIVEAVDAPSAPEAFVSPAGDAMVLVEYETNPPLEAVARPMLRVAGIRIDPGLSARRRTRRAIGLSIQRFDGSPARRIALPADARLGAPVWSASGKRFAFAVDSEGGPELWLGELERNGAAPTGLRVNDVLGGPFECTRGGKLLVWTIPADRRAPPPVPPLPAGPVIEETAGRISQMATYEDLLHDAHDEDVFEHFATSQLAVLDPASGSVSPLGPPGLYASAEDSPDGRWILLERIRRPFSRRVPFSLFARTTEVWDSEGRMAAKIADLPPSEEVPRQGVPTGPRSVEWQPLRPATLLWAEALDGGDPTRKAAHRDRLVAMSAPFAGAPRQVRLVRYRFAHLVWTARQDRAFLVERDRDRRWETTLRVDVSQTADPASDHVLFDRSFNDAYADPGVPVLETRADGERVLAQDGEAIFISGPGASESGDHPFLDRLDLATGRKERLFRSEDGVYETFVAFAGSRGHSGGPISILTRRESPEEPPNYILLDLPSGRRRPLTAFRDPAPRLSRVKKQLVRYARKDGVALSGTLYLPPDWKPGTRLPVLVWAYQLEYSDSGTAGQVRGSTKRFTRPVGASPILLALAGYAVLNDATMPVIGDPETVNNTYLEQIEDCARAAIDKLDAMGVADRARVAIGGHSYGAFMTANLLAHTDLFAAGIARSGAYNRSLTPFGFQTERRSYWEATDLYTKISPFTFAHRIRKPILLVHGEADDNSGKFPIQSERLYRAIQGNGGTARFVLLPDEAHAYRARESVLHVLAEMVEWMDRWVKGAAKP